MSFEHACHAGAPSRPPRRLTGPWTPIGEVSLTPCVAAPAQPASKKGRRRVPVQLQLLRTTSCRGRGSPRGARTRRRSAGAPPPHSRHPAARAAARGEPARRPANAAALSLSRCGERSPRRCSCARVRRCARVPSPATSLAGAHVRRRRRHGWLVDEAAARGDDDRGVRACALGGPACSCGIGARLAPGQLTAACRALQPLDEADAPCHRVAARGLGRSDPAGVARSSTPRRRRLGPDVISSCPGVVVARGPSCHVGT